MVDLFIGIYVGGALHAASSVFFAGTAGFHLSLAGQFRQVALWPFTTVIGVLREWCG
jgi:hypothetical protein